MNKVTLTLSREELATILCALDCHMCNFLQIKNMYQSTSQAQKAIEGIKEINSCKRKLIKAFFLKKEKEE